MPVPVRLVSVVGAGGPVKGGPDVQKKRPFQILRSSMVVKERPEQR